MHIPIEWQYKNLSIRGITEENPYSFEPYKDSVGCFQISCYPDGRLEEGERIQWKYNRMDDDEFCMHLFFGMQGDQALIGKYIYNKSLADDPRIKEQLLIVKNVLESIIVIPKKDRLLASKLDKYDRFIASLGAAIELLYSAIKSQSYFEIVAISATIIDAYLRLSLVINKQITTSTNDIDLKYIFQAEDEKGLLERHIYEHALNAEIIDKSLFDELIELYNIRNRVIHRYIISNIKTIDLAIVSERFKEVTEKVRLILSDYENSQLKEQFGLYGKTLGKASVTDQNAVKRFFSSVADKHA